MATPSHAGWSFRVDAPGGEPPLGTVVHIRVDPRVYAQSCLQLVIATTCACPVRDFESPAPTEGASGTDEVCVAHLLRGTARTHRCSCTCRPTPNHMPCSPLHATYLSWGFNGVADQTPGGLTGLKSISTRLFTACTPAVTGVAWCGAWPLKCHNQLMPAPAIAGDAKARTGLACNADTPPCT